MNGANNFFEGVEKLLEIWFDQSPKERGKSGDARSISRNSWEKILESVECNILDVIEHQEQVAYLLSESSLFVSRRRVILKTCGTTLCLQALPRILELAKAVCGLDIVADLFYSRKNFMHPDRQPHMHKTFQQEVEYLDKHFIDKSAAYCLGRLNGDCWFLYTLNHAGNDSLVGIREPDQTLEILLQELDEDVMKQFVKYDDSGGIKSPDAVTQELGIADLIPNSNISAVLFEPCGYSMNGMLGKDLYWTIHITPEPECSYVSFETNIPKKDYTTLLNKIMKLFVPQRFTMTLFVNYASTVDKSTWDTAHGPVISGYKCQDKQVAQLQNYCLYYTNYKLKPG